MRNLSALLLILLFTDFPSSQQEVVSDNVTVSLTSVPFTLADDDADEVSEKRDDDDTSNLTCEPGILLPIWNPMEWLFHHQRAGRAITYFFALCYFFLGVSIIADRFVGAIEVITSVERDVKIKDAHGEVHIVRQRVWNQTVSNLSLLALGEAAPEILLAIIEIVGNNFEAEDLGPGTIVGSAAYNLFVVIGLCVFVIPTPETRRVQRTLVFWVSIAWSLFAYVWLYLILAVISHGVVEVWEAVLTLAFFFVTLLTSWMADKKLLNKEHFQCFRLPKHRNVRALAASGPIPSSDVLPATGRTDIEATGNRIDRYRVHPATSTAFHHVISISNSNSSSDIQKDSESEHSEDIRNFIFLAYAPLHHISCSHQNVTLHIHVLCDRTNCIDPRIVMVDYRTLDDDNRCNTKHIEGTLTYGPYEETKTIRVNFSNYQPIAGEQGFQLCIYNPRVHTDDDELPKPQVKIIQQLPNELGYALSLANDAHGLIRFELDADLCLTDDAASTSQLTVPLSIVKDEFGRGATSSVVPTTTTTQRKGYQRVRHQLKIKLLRALDDYKDQFVDALKVLEDDQDDDKYDCAHDRKPTPMDYVLYALSLPWKLMFAIVPPESWCGGWLCFLVSIAVIGVLTAFIGDLARHFGCTVGLKDVVTAIAFVAIGTNVPDTFASKIVAIKEQHADSSIVNIAGSNAVNVFMGIGISWTIAAVYHAVHGSTFVVQPGSLGFSVTLYLVGAAIAIAILQVRRYLIGAELGGPLWSKIATMLTFYAIWLLYVVLSSLEAYSIIDGY